MITQYSHQQITLSDREKEYAWFHYAAQIINAGCMDQSLSGYSITGTGSDGKIVSAELTNEELLDLCQYFEHKKLKGYADFFNSSSSFCCGVI